MTFSKQQGSSRAFMVEDDAPKRRKFTRKTTNNTGRDGGHTGDVGLIYDDSLYLQDEIGNTKESVEDKKRKAKEAVLGKKRVMPKPKKPHTEALRPYNEAWFGKNVIQSLDSIIKDLNELAALDTKREKIHKAFHAINDYLGKEEKFPRVGCMAGYHDHPGTKGCHKIDKPHRSEVITNMGGPAAYERVHPNQTPQDDGR